MIHGKRVVVVLPAYNAAKTLRQTFDELPHDIVDHVILVDDASQDETSRLARQLGITTFIHSRNLGYGGEDKNCSRGGVPAGAPRTDTGPPAYPNTAAPVTAVSVRAA